MRWWKKTMQKIKNPEENAKLTKWKRKYDEAKSLYSDKLNLMKYYAEQYDGTRKVNPNPNKPHSMPSKVSINVRNISYELIESQVDSSIPMPKVIPIHKEDTELAQIIEDMLNNEIRMLRFNEINDKSERTVPIQGGDFMQIDWDNTKSTHCTLGGLSISNRHPRNVIPQPGVTEVDNMDYIFVLIPQTKEYIKRRYGIDVSDAANTELDTVERINTYTDEIVTIVQCYYKNKHGGIGRFAWVEDYVIEDSEDYQSRKLKRCEKCGRVKQGDVCECGSKKFKEVNEANEELVEDIVLFGTGEVIPASQYTEKQAEINGEPQFDEMGQPIIVEIEERTKIPYYKPNEMPVILRRNVSREGELLGFSDIAVIIDQQDAIKKYGSKIQEKILKGGSIVTLPDNLKISTTDEELKIVRVKTPADIQMIQAINIMADTTADRIMLESNYEAAKSALGITDAYQGKYDSSAKSGTAKQYSINQAAGRLESKRVMKNAAYSRLYEMMFKWLLAYADQPIPLSKKNSKGEYEFSHFNRYDFLKRDAAGELYWNDEFIFETDPTSTIMMNREAMWQQIDMKYQAGAFGPIGEPKTLLAYWTFMEDNDYPNSAQMKKLFSERVQEEEQQQQMMAQQQEMSQQMPQGGGMNLAMPQM